MPVKIGGATISKASTPSPHLIHACMQKQAWCCAPCCRNPFLNPGYAIEITSSKNSHENRLFFFRQGFLFTHILAHKLKGMVGVQRISDKAITWEGHKMGLEPKQAGHPRFMTEPLQPL